MMFMLMIMTLVMVAMISKNDKDETRNGILLEDDTMLVTEFV